jgi:hypothetical protein
MNRIVPPNLVAPERDGRVRRPSGARRRFS